MRTTHDIPALPVATQSAGPAPPHCDVEVEAIAEVMENDAAFAAGLLHGATRVAT